MRKFLAASFVLALPILVFAAGFYAYSWGAPGVQRVLWAPVVATNSALESLCVQPGSGSFVCPANQAAYDQLFYASFFLAYVLIGTAIVLGTVVYRRHSRVRPHVE